MIMKMKSLALLGLASAFSWAAELPEAVLPAGVGVNIHFTRGHETDLDMIAAAGFKFVAWISAGAAPNARKAIRLVRL